ncbi:Vacuolar assembly/sorting proteins VPS39/VAM6/VPS3 [Handroanthus impetiginosus]|uniref:Vacuolar assembly/sorting proteins VPS39/VAM6/VPS3 n=1 Tax=Handroanthus impetiginosus TaxID=429701 RepID=A0A2G9GPE4_9LAMI|nr:Vacuolar assembly/sorting proteins VPS39/VAM6/VPS3 [Handroanthus impetiginosus]
MVHTAYDSFQLITNSSTRIDAIESYGSALLLSCSDGSLRIYSPESSAGDHRSPPSPSEFYSQSLELKKEPYVLERTINGFSKKPMLAMEVLKARELLLSLSESIAFHRLPNLETLAVITKAKGANAYCWDERRGFLCFARQKKVCIFRHDGGRGFVEVKEFGVPDTVKSMSWCGENICLGIRREYVILNSINGALSEVFPSGRIAPPLVVSLPSEELLLGKDNIGVFVDQNGKLLQEGRICWSEAPAAVVVEKPYVVGLLPRHVEIRSLRDPYPLIQTVVLRNVRRLLQSTHVIIVALENSVYGLFPVPLGAQIVQLTASGNFEEALALCKLLPPEDSNLRAAKEQSIHIRYAHYLFENGSYEEAMEHFLASQVEINYVLSLYPSIVLPKSSVLPEPEKYIDGDAPDLSRGSSGISDDMESSIPHALDSEESSDLESRKMSHNTLMALIKFLQRKRYGIVEKAAAEGTEEAVSDAVGNNFVSYGNSRLKKPSKGRANIPISSVARDTAAILDTALLQALLLTGQPSAALELLKGLNYCDVKICEEFLLERNQYVCLLELYKCNNMHREALTLLHKLVEQSNSSNPPAELKQKFKPEMIIDYLKPLCGTDPMLVLEFSMLVLESCPNQTIELFLSGNIPADLVNSYLKQHAPSMQTTYLELMLAMNENSISGNLQNEMVQIYLSEVLDWYADLNSQQKWDEKTYSPTRKKLLSALESISGYDPEVLLKRLPPDALYEERAILLGKMNQHELALSIYVHKLNVPELALSYCDWVYESGLQHSAKSYGNIYLTLLQIYLNPRKTTKNFEKRITNLISARRPGIPKFDSAAGKNKLRLSRKIAEIEGAEENRISQSGTDSGKSDGDTDDVIEEGASTIMLDKVLDLLGRRWERINGAQALRLLPRETKLKNLLPFLGPLLRKSSEAYRNFSVIKSLRESENLQVKDELYSQRKNLVKITGDSMCSLCNKKIGGSVFAVYPNGKTIVHFVCFKDSQNMKAVAKGSTLWKR